jgi:hypothetical protein
MVKCGLNQVKSSAICKKRDFAATRIERAESGEQTVTRVPGFFSKGPIVRVILGSRRM